MFYDQFIKLCENANIKPTSLLVQLGMSKGSLANWKAGKLPSGEILVRFSEHFNVSIDYLVFGKKNDHSISIEDSEWLTLIQKLPIEAQYEFKGELKGYIKRLEEEPVAADELKQAK